MFLKRSLVLMAGLCLFVIGFIIYFRVSDSAMEDGFRQERAKFGAENMVLTTSDMSTAPAASSSSGDAVAPAPVIGPVPPSSSSDTPAPMSTPAPAPAPMPAPSTAPGVDPNGIPMPSLTPSSTEYRGPQTRPAYFVDTAYRPAFAQVTNAMPGTTPLSSPVTSGENEAAATNAPAAEAMSTNAPASNRPLPVEASVIVLGYHQFTGPGVPSKNIYSIRQDVFAAEMKYLHDNNYHVVPLADVVRFVKHEIGLPPNSVAITIDDGYKSPIVWAAPILKQYNYPWTFFVYPDFITVAEGKGAASWNDLKALQADGVDIECHSKSHPIMTKHGNKTPEQYDAWLTAETSGAKATIEEHLGTPVKFFAYPYGAYNKQVEAKTTAAGFDAIFTVADNPVHNTSNVYSLGRYIITQPVEKNFAAYLRQGALSLAAADPAPGATISQARPVITAVLSFAGTLDPKSIEAEVRDFGRVPCDYDPKTSTVRLYLQRDLIQSVVTVSIRARDASSGQMLVANWHFNFEPGGPAAAAPVGKALTTAPEPATNIVATPASLPVTNQAVGAK